MKNYKLLFFYVLFVLLMISGCAEDASNVINKPIIEESASDEQIVTEDEYLLFVEDEVNTYLGDLYLKRGINEKEKLSSNVLKYSYKFYPIKKIAVFLDKDHNLYIKESGKEKELISTDATNKYTLLDDESGIMFLKSDYEFYKKIWGKEKEKIASNVMDYKFTSDGNIIYYKDYGYNLYVNKDGAEKEKLSSDAIEFYCSESGNIVYYMNSYGDLYRRDLSKPDNEKLTSGNIYDIQVCSDGNMIVYLNEYNYEKLKGELYYLKNGETPKKIASDVTKYQICNDGKIVYYLNEENNLLSAIPGKDERTKISL